MDYLFLQAFALIKSQGPVVGGLALSLILAIMAARKELDTTYSRIFRRMGTATNI